MILDDKLGDDADTVYTALMDAHAGLTDAQSHALNARLVLILANEIGSAERILPLIAAAHDADPG